MEYLCRTCTGPTDENAVKIFGSGVFKQLIICTSLDCDENDEYPNLICHECSEKLACFYEFRNMCIQSINSFNTILKETAIEVKDINLPQTIALEPPKPAVEVEALPVVVLDMKSEIYECDLIEELVEEEIENHSDGEQDMFDTYIAMDEEYVEENPLEKSEDEEEDEDEEVEEVSEEEFLDSDFEAKPDVDDNEEGGKKRKKKYFECTKCSKKFVKEERLGNHMRIHEGLKPFPCSQCHRAYMKLANLNLHIKESHRLNGEKLVIPCTHEGCDKTFDKRHSLLAHLRYKHSNKVRPIRTYICETCGKTFKTSWSLKEHKYLHLGEESYPYKCDQCQKRFIAQKAFKEHLLRHSGIKNFECQYCGMRKTTARELRTHLNYHTKEKQWPCPLCPSVFNAKGNLKLHNDRVHLGIKNYNCQYCDQSFSKSETLKHHEMTHTGEKPHVCTICNKRFIQAIALKTHMKTHSK